MTRTLAPRSAYTPNAAGVPGGRCSWRTGRSAGGFVLRHQRELVVSPGLPGPPMNDTGAAVAHASPPGAIGGAVIRAARRSARMTSCQLACTVAVSPGTVHAWEAGSIALFCVSYRHLSQLASAFDRAGARIGRDVGDLVLASQCDLLLTGMLQGFEDYAEVPPIEDETEGVACRSLLRWALTGIVPEPYRPYSEPGRLLASHDLEAIKAVACGLQAGNHDNELASYGTALLALTDQ